MTQSEKICNQIGKKFFSKDYVYENLKYFTTNNEKVELCDGLFEYAGTYLALQIKERNESASAENDEKWLNNTVYGEAVKQIKITIDRLNSDNIKVNNLYHQEIELQKGFLIYPVIIFQNPNQKNYKRVIIEDDIKINVFSLEDFNDVLNIAITPYDIFRYLNKRVELCKNGLVHTLNIETENKLKICKINNEKDLAENITNGAYNFDDKKRHAALEVMALRDTYKDNLITKNKNYRKIIDILQLIQPEQSVEFMDRFWGAWKDSCNDSFNIFRKIMLLTDSKKISIVFFSMGLNKIDNLLHYQILLDALTLKFNIDEALIISFKGNKDNTCQIDWVLMSNADNLFIPDDKLLEFYEGIGFFNGTLEREDYEKLISDIE